MTEAGPGRKATMLRQVALGAGVTAVALGVGAAIPLWPLLRDDYRLDDVVRAVALDVRDFGEEKGSDRLRFELAAQGLDARLHPDDCAIVQGEGGIDVTCSWEVVLEVGLVGRRLPIRFSSRAHVTPDGDLSG